MDSNLGAELKVLIPATPPPSELQLNGNGFIPSPTMVLH